MPFVNVYENWIISNRYAYSLLAIFPCFTSFLNPFLLLFVVKSFRKPYQNAIEAIKKCITKSSK